MRELGYQELLPVQEEVFPHVMNHQNTALQSATGTGKTLSYLQENWQFRSVMIFPGLRYMKRSGLPF